MESKAVSARWILTVMCGVAFLEIVTAQVVFVILYQRVDLLIMTSGEIGIIISTVFLSYFNRTDRNNGDGK